MLNLILLGPPGAGKGTQADNLRDTFDLTKLSTGDMLREAVKKGTEIGKRAQLIMSNGGLVPDDIMISLIRNAIWGDNCPEGFILDGFPRTTAQAIALDKMLLEEEKQLDFVIELKVDNTVLTERITGRFACKQCGAGYHDKFRPPVAVGQCDVCKSRDFVRRDDDVAETVVKRLEAYDAMTAPLLPYYESKGILRTVDGMADIAEVTRAINAIVTRGESEKSARG